MIFTIITIIFFIAGLITLISGFVYFKNGKKINIEIQEENKVIDQKNKELRQENSNLNFENENKKNELNNLNKQYNSLNNELTIKKTQLEDLELTTEKVIENKKQLSQKAFENYCLILEQNYEEKEKEYAESNNLLEESYSEQQIKILWELDKIQEELSQLKATRAAAFQAQLKEKEIKEQLSFYCLSINQNDLDDIKVLERMKSQLHNPRILSMLIWSTYFQKPMTKLCNNVLGTSVITGIYKITNQLDDMCYVGQSVNVADRWKQHAKCGLGIDTPQNNKLYQAMIQDGLWNFSFELLEECPRELLNEKEKFYIDLYDSKEYGYNSSIGVGK